MMKVTGSHRWLISLGVMLSILVGLWALGSALAQEPGAAREEQPQGELDVAATVNSRISYQGLLTQDGEPVNGNRNMVFRFYTSSNCSTGLVQSVAINNVPVSQGQFMAALNVDQGNFDGQGLWLKVEVGGTSVGCQEILAAPYALSLRPSAEVKGGVASPSAVLELDQSNTGSAAFALYGSATTVGIYGIGTETGIKGHSYGHVGGRAGVWGESEMGYGVRGTSTYYTGVYGETGATSHPAGRFVNTGTVFPGNQVGLWAGSFYNNVIEGHDVDAAGYSLDRVFRVSRFGDVYADGTYYGAGGVNTSCSPECADLAETMDADRAGASYEPGDVLVVDSQGLVSRASEAYTSHVIGVYSTRPAFLARAGNSDNQVPVALVGVVPVKASAENGPILPGDLLVASSTPGHAMRAGSDPAVGTVIGKALEPLDAGTGLIQMLVVLQ